mmetsp:Transcript_51883/g.76896  ORF Transcript_51883/g.76896 Transcript_51883/m.76896 type:complete len:524 (+) Transcript_51883:115-1686(+)
MKMPRSAGGPTWQEMFRRLNKHGNIVGSCQVPLNYSFDTELAEWVKLQRRQYKLLIGDGNIGNLSLPNSKLNKDNDLTIDRMMKLENIGFEWDLYGENSVSGRGWKMRFQQLHRYKLEHGDCLVSSRHSKNPQLGHWVMTQRRQGALRKKGKASTLTEERIKLLDSIGFVWVIREEFSVLWKKRYKELAEYKKKYGDCLVPQRYPDNPQLGTWVSTQRIHYKLLQEGKQSSMTKKRIIALEKLCFSWISPTKIGTTERRAGNSLSSIPGAKKGNITMEESKKGEGIRPDLDTSQARSSVLASGTSVAANRHPPEKNLIQYFKEKESMDLSTVAATLSPTTKIPPQKRVRSVLEDGHNKAVKPSFKTSTTPRKRTNLACLKHDANIHHYHSNVVPKTPLYPPIHDDASNCYQHYHDIDVAAIPGFPPFDPGLNDPYNGHEQTAMSTCHTEFMGRGGFLHENCAHGHVSRTIRQAIDNPLKNSQYTNFNLLQHYLMIIGKIYTTSKPPPHNSSIHWSWHASNKLN